MCRTCRCQPLLAARKKQRACSRGCTACSPGRSLPCSPPISARPQAPFHRPGRRAQAHRPPGQGLSTRPALCFMEFPMRKTFAAAAAAASLILATSAASAAEWTVDPAKSSIGFTVEQGGAPVSGSFGTWTAQIDFDPENVSAAKIEATIATGSAQMANAQLPACCRAQTGWPRKPSRKPASPPPPSRPRAATPMRRKAHCRCAAKKSR
ncbi:YceI family protein [Pannonibacter sp. Pt2-lr]